MSPEEYVQALNNARTHLSKAAQEILAARVALLHAGVDVEGELPVGLDRLAHNVVQFDDWYRTQAITVANTSRVEQELRP